MPAAALRRRRFRFYRSVEGSRRSEMVAGWKIDRLQRERKSRRSRETSAKEKEGAGDKEGGGCGRFRRGERDKERREINGRRGRKRRACCHARGFQGRRRGPRQPETPTAALGSGCA